MAKGAGTLEDLDMAKAWCWSQEVPGPSEIRTDSELLPWQEEPEPSEIRTDPISPDIWLLVDVARGARTLGDLDATSDCHLLCQEEPETSEIRTGYDVGTYGE